MSKHNIKSKKFLRLIFQLAALGIFLFQMQNSIRKFNQRPVVQQSSTVLFDNIKKPVIYLCQDTQYNFKRGEDYGYLSSTRYTMGHVQKGDDKITWKGNSGNKTPQALQMELNDVDYKDFRNTFIYLSLELFLKSLILKRVI